MTFHFPGFPICGSHCGLQLIEVPPPLLELVSSQTLPAVTYPQTIFPGDFFYSPGPQPWLRYPYTDVTVGWSANACLYFLHNIKLKGFIR